MTRIYILDLNYTFVSNQKDTYFLRPFSKRLEQEEYRRDLLEAIRNNYVIIITARPDYQGKESLQNIQKKMAWNPQEAYFNEKNLAPPACKEDILLRYVFPKHGKNGENVEYYAIESNPRTREMYAKYNIFAEPYEEFIKRCV